MSIGRRMEERPTLRPGYVGSWAFEWPEENCAGCGESILPPATIFVADDGEIYHWDCRPRSFRERISEGVERLSHRFQF